jgi:GntR family transcriptional regulator
MLWPVSKAVKQAGGLIVDAFRNASSYKSPMIGKVTKLPNSGSVSIMADAGVEPIDRGENSASRGVPLYHQVFLLLRHDIISGKYQPGDALPGEHVLSNQYNVSRVTIRKALDRLCADAVLRRVQGSGTYVAKVFADVPVVAPLSSFSLHAESLAKNTTVRLIRLEYTQAPPAIAAMMEVEAGTALQHSHRIRSFENTPFLLLDTYLPQEIATQFDVAELERASLHLTLRRIGICFGAADCSITAVAADAYMARLLEVPASSPLLREIWIQRDTTNRVIECNTIYARPDIYVLRTSFRSSGADPGGRT